MSITSPIHSDSLADVLERVLDKGVVIAGDVSISLVGIELLSIKVRLLITTVDKAVELGINWWENDPALTTPSDPDRFGAPSDPLGLDAREEARLEPRLGGLASALTPRRAAPAARADDAQGDAQGDAQDDAPDDGYLVDPRLARRAEAARAPDPEPRAFLDIAADAETVPDAEADVSVQDAPAGAAPTGPARFHDDAGRAALERMLERGRRLEEVNRELRGRLEILERRVSSLGA